MNYIYNNRRTDIRSDIYVLNVDGNILNVGRNLYLWLEREKDCIGIWKLKNIK